MSEQKGKVKLRGVIRHVYKKTGRAINDYGMISDKDKILIGVSGGGDSLSLLKMLQLRKAHIPIDFEIVACFVDAGFDKELPLLLEEHFKKEDVAYVIKPLGLGKDEIECFWCSWNRRKILFKTAREQGCNKIALAHHLDDISETILMNLFFHGKVSAMAPLVRFFKGELTMIRPFAYLEKKEIEQFYSLFDFPKEDYVCPRASHSKRALIKDTINRLQEHYPYIKTNIFKALRKDNIKLEYLT